jgi:hypothetical protein
MDENQIPNPAPPGPPPRPERPWQEEHQAISDIDQKISRLEGLPRAPAPERPPSGGGSKRWAGVPVVLAVVFGSRLLFGLSRTHDSPRYEPPPPHINPAIHVEPVQNKGIPVQNQGIEEIIRDKRERERNNRQVPPQPFERPEPVGPPEL